MKWRTIGLSAAFSASLAVGETATTGDLVVELKASPPLTKSVDRFPRIAAPADQAQQRINEALNRRDAQAQSAVRSCTTGGWSRSISVAMRGPRYLAFVAQDSWNCGNPHDDGSRLVLVYDLSTGSPVNWARLLPTSLVQSSTLDTAGDGTRIGVIGSHTLQEFYINAQFAGTKNAVDPGCRDVLQDSKLNFSLWPDAKAEGIAIEPQGLAHVVAACGGSLVIPVPELRKMGVQGTLLDAIETAHAHGWYGFRE